MACGLARTGTVSPREHLVQPSPKGAFTFGWGTRGYQHADLCVNIIALIHKHYYSGRKKLMSLHVVSFFFFFLVARIKCVIFNGEPLN